LISFLNTSERERERERREKNAESRNEAISRYKRRIYELAICTADFFGINGIL